jgi:hypothetical protein
LRGAHLPCSNVPQTVFSKFNLLDKIKKGDCADDITTKANTPKNFKHPSKMNIEAIGNGKTKTIFSHTTP